MGTRADFYIGRGEDAEWLGSVGWVAHPAGFSHRPALFAAKSEQEFRLEVAAELATRNDSTVPEQGWPWPWANSSNTCYVYVFDDGRVLSTNASQKYYEDPVRFWFDPAGNEMVAVEPLTQEWPDMTHIQKVTLGRRSGIVIVGADIED